MIKTRFQASSSNYERLLCKNSGDYNNAHSGSNLYKSSNRFYNQSHHQHHHTFTLNTNFLIRNAANAKNVLATHLNFVDTSQFNNNHNSISSTVNSNNTNHNNNHHHHHSTANSATAATTSSTTSANTKHIHSSTMTSHLVKKNAKRQTRRIGTGIYLHLRFIVEHEGYRALFKGILPNIIGVAPYRAIYFYSYAHAKQTLMRFAGENKNLLHICSAYLAGKLLLLCF